MTSAFFLRAMVVAGAAFMAAGVQAATVASCSAEGQGKSAASYSLSPASEAECFTGNDTNTIDGDFLMLGETGWTLAAKTDDGNGDKALTFGESLGGKGGSWSIVNELGFDLSQVALTLKAGNSFAAFDITDLSGTWSASKDLSHASIYYRGEAPEPSPIPLPAAGWLLIGGLGGLTALRRRRG